MVDQNKRERSTAVNYAVLLCLGVTVFLFLSFIYRSFVYLGFLLAAGAVLFLAPEEIFMFLLYFFPFAVIFKPYADATSLFTYLEVLVVCILGMQVKKLNKKIVVVICLLFSIVMIYMPSISTVIKFFNILALYYLFTEFYKKEDSGNYLYFFFGGFAVSTILGIWKEEIPSVAVLYSDFNYEWFNKVQVIRFSGIFTDPNYFCIPVMLCFVIIFVHILQEGQKSNFWKLALLGVLIAGGFSLSKSFYILVALLFFYLLLLFRKNIGSVFGIAFLIAMVIYLNPFGLVSKVLYRFSDYDLTTGRVDIWRNYISVITDNLVNFLTGYGLSAPFILRATHNIYLEMLYYIGFIGTVLCFIFIYLTTVYRSKPIDRCIINYLGVIIMAIQYSFLCGITTYEIPFYLMIMFLIYNNDYVNGEDIFSGK